VHGAEETERITAASAALFGTGDLRGVGWSTLHAALATARELVTVGVDDVPTIVDLLVETGLVKSKGEARRAVSEGGAYLNNERVEDPEYVPTEADLIEDRLLVLRRGKKSFAGVEVR
jgi:tyrosyl-tRNA synthetase